MSAQCSSSVRCGQAMWPPLALVDASAGLLASVLRPLGSAKFQARFAAQQSVLVVFCPQNSSSEQPRPL